jgi:hypothetical protein
MESREQGIRDHRVYLITILKAYDLFKVSHLTKKGPRGFIFNKLAKQYILLTRIINNDI